MRRADEEKRLEALQRYAVLDTAYEAIFNDIASVAARICDTPISAISLIDADRQWFKAHVGIAVRETSRDLAFCAHTILDPTRVLVVNDASTDARFATNPFVTGDSNIRFYAGAPIVTPSGEAIGSMCVIDTQARTIDGEQAEALRRLSEQVIAILEVRRTLVELAPFDGSQRRLRGNDVAS
jgi:GAF domain-containing protein